MHQQPNNSILVAYLPASFHPTGLVTRHGGVLAVSVANMWARLVPLQSMIFICFKGLIIVWTWRDVFSFALVLLSLAWQHLLSEVACGAIVDVILGLQWQSGCQERFASRGMDPLALASLRSSQQICISVHTVPGAEVV